MLPLGMPAVDCGEITLDEQLALASAISDKLSGRAVALVKDSKLVLDVISGKVTVEELRNIVEGFVSRRKEAEHYSVEVVSDVILVHGPDPLARSKGRRDSGQILPGNLMKCPFSGCGFVTPYPELYTIHVRSHGA